MQEFSSIDVGAIRANYTLHELSEEKTGADPIVFFQQWFAEAVASKVNEVNAMVLSTLNTDGFPEGRVVLLKDLEEGNFVFFTNYQSAKGKHLDQCEKVSLVFFWPELQRQVRVLGTVSKIEPQQSEQYFHSRPRGSQIAAWASAQSKTISSREVLENAVKKLEAEYEQREIPCPDFWGGYAVNPVKIEFWQGRNNRLHDRILFEKQTTWVKHRLSP